MMLDPRLEKSAEHLRRKISAFAFEPAAEARIRRWINRMLRSSNSRILLLILVCECIVQNIESFEDRFGELLREIALQARNWLPFPQFAAIAAREAIATITNGPCGKPVKDSASSSRIADEYEVQDLCARLGNISVDRQGGMEEIIDYLQRVGWHKIANQTATLRPHRSSDKWWVTRASQVDNVAEAPRGAGDTLADELRDALGLSQRWTGRHAFEYRFAECAPPSELRTPTVFETGVCGRQLFQPRFVERRGGWGSTIDPRNLEPSLDEAVCAKPAVFGQGCMFRYIGEVTRDAHGVRLGDLEESLLQHVARLEAVLE